MPTDGNDSPNQKGKIEELDQWVQEYIRELRDENKQKRLALERVEEDARKREQAQLEEQGNWKKLAEDRANELARVKPYEERANTLDAQLRASNDAQIAKLPEHIQKAVPSDYPPEKVRTWLDTIAPLLIKPPAPDLNQGGGGLGDGKPELTEDELAMARQMKLSPEAYAKQKRKK